MINYKWITTQPVFSTLHPGIFIYLHLFSERAFVFWRSLCTYVHTNTQKQTQDSSILCTGLWLSPGGCISSPPSPKWWCSGLVGPRYALALPLRFNRLQPIFPLPNSVCNCLPLSLIICLPLHLASLTEPHPSLCLNGTGGCMLPNCRQEKKEALELPDAPPCSRWYIKCSVM